MNLPGTPELMVIALVALLIFGPRKMPEIGRSIGGALREFRRTSQEVMDTIHGALDVDTEPEPALKKRRATPNVEEED
jgi:sec-independent protein translocase protein TatA